VCLDLDAIPVMFVEQKQQSDECSFGSLQTMGTAKDIWREPFTHPVISLIHIMQQNEGTNYYLVHPLYNQNKAHNIS